MANTDLLELADRVDKLEGPFRETDLAIMCALDLRPDWLARSQGHMWIDGSGIHPVIRWADDAIGEGLGNPSVDDGPGFSAPLDAAMQLVPAGWTIERSGRHNLDPDPFASFELWQYRRNAGGEWRHGSGEVAVKANGTTPALALTACALRARAEIERLSE
ncbi:MAG TPA: hypothetical protein VF503_24355 [Sphingobium sp.]|uniref:hypothetical protein n=1 Tax=Sphingobium sp. TaxID=1912891 RepID=UPI002ED39206